MAKYILNRTSRGVNAVNCSILDENCLANTYTVQFTDGTIRNVDKKKVRQLDALDEAVLDRLKAFASKLWDNIVKAGKYIYSTVKGKIVNAFSPINTMIAAREVNGLTFIPGENLAQRAEEQGIDAQEVVDEPDEEDVEFSKNANQFWHQIIDGYQEDDEEEITDEELAYESQRPRRSLASRMNEARNEIALEHKSWQNVHTKELAQMLLQQYNQYLSGAANNPNERPIPYCIWGAPGIGKTQVIYSLIDELRDAEVNANIIGINAMSMRKDDFALPGHRQTINTLKLKDGSDYDYTVDTAVELPKSWLPAYDPNDVDEANGITEEVLDDWANGGDGSGNGDGGFFFIDELSRISPDVNNVIMVLVQSRTFQGKKLGSKWMFVAAANRPSDMGDNAALFKWDAAQTGRFLHVNFVPTFEEWVEWAESPIRGTNEPHIEPIIVDFLREHQNVWYNAAMYNKEDEKDKVSRTMSPTARGWELATKAMRTKKAAADSRLAKLYQAKGLNPKGREDLSAAEMSDVLRQTVGNQAADMFKGWAGFDAIFTNAIAKSVWTQGDKAKIPFRPNNVTMNGALDKILANYPTTKKVVTPGSSTPRLPLTADQLENVVKYLIKCVDQMDEREGSAKDPVLRALQAQLILKLTNAPFSLSLNSSRSQDTETFADALSLLNDRLNQTGDLLYGEQ